jgi:hypothetical protein
MCKRHSVWVPLACAQNATRCTHNPLPEGSRASVLGGSSPNAFPLPGSKATVIIRAQHVSSLPGCTAQHTCQRT